ncbi:hypothetical protein GF345_06430 [Candidatus Woesearchaeota archaeon]|nr:hypothetical protein [Candidatus Woesearchaeota archaeon]
MTVEQEALKYNIYGALVTAVRKDGKELARFDRQSRKKIANWHEVFICKSELGELIVDVNSPEQVYLAKEYLRKCFEDHDNIELRIYEEP